MAEYLKVSEDQAALFRARAERLDSTFKAAHTGAAPIISPNGYSQMNIKNMIDTGRNLRDKLLWQLPILPGAVFVFQQLASGREWVVAGKPQRVQRAVEWLQLAETWNVYTGDVQYGFDDFLKRQSLDYLTIGRVATLTRRRRNGANPNKSPLEYVDPALLVWRRQKKDRFDKVKPAEKVWNYANNSDIFFRHDEIFLHHPLPIGTGLFAAPLAAVVPTALLAWLIREHNSASVDGRKIREIMMVSGVNVRETLENAIKIAAAKWAGADPEGQAGIPIVEVQNPHGVPLKDLIASLGLSVIPDDFSEEEFTFIYVNEIAAALGLALRHFWQSERTTNKALETVQEQRQQLKGPATFTRSIQRMLNRPNGPMEMFSSGRNRTRFAFIEEVDVSTRKNNAEVLKTIAEALEKIQTVFGMAIDLQSYLAWMQAENVLPNELVLVDPGVAPETVRRNPDDGAMAQEGEQRQESDPTPVAVPAQVTQKQKAYPEPDYDEIVVDSEGRVVERRVKVYSVSKFLEREIKAATQVIEANDSSLDPYEAALIAVGLTNQAVFNTAYGNGHKQLVDTWVDSQLIYDGIEARQAIEKCVAGEVLSRSEQNVINAIVQGVLPD